MPNYKITGNNVVGFNKGDVVSLPELPAYLINKAEETKEKATVKLPTATTKKEEKQKTTSKQTAEKQTAEKQTAEKQTDAPPTEEKAAEE